MVKKLNMLFTCGNTDMIYDFVQHLVEKRMYFGIHIFRHAPSDIELQQTESFKAICTQSTDI